MREYLKNNLGEYETRIATDFNRQTGEIRKQSLGAIVPLVKFQSDVLVDVIDIEQRLKARTFSHK